MDYDESPKYSPKPNLNPKKVMITVWWYKGEIILFNFLEKGKSSTAQSHNQESVTNIKKSINIISIFIKS